jgi:hypothetical protein
MAVVLAARPAFAHHGFAVHYDVADQVRIEGTIDQVLLKNPHSEVRVLVSDKDGADVVWTCETQAASILKRKGITADRFVVGAAIAIEGSHARRNPHGCEIGRIHFANGDSVTLRSAAGQANIAVNTDVAMAAGRPRSVFGRWVRDSFTGAPVTPGFLDSITAAGQSVNANYDGSRDDPTLKCSPVNPVRAWIAPGTPTEIREHDGRIEIQHEFMDTTRVINMDGSGPPTDTRRSEMGYSTGRFDGQALVVETSYFDAGVLLTHVKNSGVLHSDELHLTEVISVDPASGELRIQWEARDALYFPKPISGELLLSPTGLAIDKFNCVNQTVY